MAVLSGQIEALDVALANYKAQPRWRRLPRWGGTAGALDFAQAMAVFERELDRLGRPRA